MTAPTAAACLMCLVTAAAAQAQPQGSPPTRPHRVTASAGLVWAGGYAIGDNAARLRRNEPGTTRPAPFTLFSADASMRRATGFDARLAYALTDTLVLEVGGRYAKPQLVVRIAGDAESQPVTLGDEHIAQYTLGGHGIWQMTQLELARRMMPYLIGGVSYLRQLSEDRVNVETGRLYLAGAGVRYWLRGRDRTSHAFGLRGELRMEIRSGGIDIAGKPRAFPAISLMGFFGL